MRTDAFTEGGGGDVTQPRTHNRSKPGSSSTAPKETAFFPAETKGTPKSATQQGHCGTDDPS